MSDQEQIPAEQVSASQPATDCVEPQAAPEAATPAADHSAHVPETKDHFGVQTFFTVVIFQLQTSDIIKIQKPERKYLCL